jgi:hypothetical protein
MDTKKCDVCRDEFDFDVSGLGGPNGIVVCSNTCAEKSAASRGKKYMIHDKYDRVIQTNVISRSNINRSSTKKRKK